MSDIQKLIESAPTGNNDTVTFENIVEWCKENGKVQWLKDYKANHERLNVRGLRKDFYLAFFPARVTAKPKKPTMASVIDAL